MQRAKYLGWDRAAKRRWRDNEMADPIQELVFAPLGGVGEIGMNLSIYGLGNERRRTWLAVDCGIEIGRAHV